MITKKVVIQTLILALVAGSYFFISNMFFKGSSSNTANSFKVIDNPSDLKSQCESLSVGTNILETGSVLVAHNRKLIANTQSGRVGTYWISDGLNNLHIPKGEICVAHFSPNDELKSATFKLLK